MRRVLLAVTLASLPAFAWAQTATPAHPRATRPAHSVAIAPPTDAQASGADTLAGESASASDTPASSTTDAPTATAPAPQAAAETAPAGVAAPGISLSENGAPQQPATPTHAPAPTHAAAAPSTGVAAPGVNVNSSAHPTPTRTAMQPANDLERAFVNAAHQASARTAFRHTFLDSQVALATVSTAPNAPAREIRLGPGGEACLIFTSDARATQIMGAGAPRQLMTGRQALERIRGAPLVIININMDPYLTLDAAGIDAFLGADAPAAAASAGPSQ